MVISVDFDGIIVENAYPDIGEPIKGAAETINRLYDEGNYIVINTCRNGEYEQAAKKYLELASIKHHKLNQNLEHLIERYGSDTRKISADVYIDDKNLFGGKKTWEQIYNKLIKHEAYGNV